MTVLDLLTFLLQIVQGMAYLEDVKIAHGDLSACVHGIVSPGDRNIDCMHRRNVLVGDQGRLCKISDFGSVKCTVGHAAHVWQPQ